MPGRGTPSGSLHYWLQSAQYARSIRRRVISRQNRLMISARTNLYASKSSSTMDVTRTIHHSMDVNTSWRLMPIPYRFGCVFYGGGIKPPNSPTAPSLKTAVERGPLAASRTDVARTWTVKYQTDRPPRVGYRLTVIDDDARDRCAVAVPYLPSRHCLHTPGLHRRFERRVVAVHLVRPRPARPKPKTSEVAGLLPDGRVPRPSTAD